MNCVWDWLQNGVNILAVPTFLMLIWQIWRNEGQQPAESISIRVQHDGDTGIVTASTGDGYMMHFAALEPLRGCEGVFDPALSRTSNGVGDNAGDFGLRVRQTGDECVVLLEWVSPTALRRRPEAHARRIIFNLRKHPVPVRSERWQWFWYAPAIHLCENIPGMRRSMRLGRWCPMEESWWKSSLPESELPKRGLGTLRDRIQH